MEETASFANFNKRYFDSLVLTVNALQYLTDTKYLYFDNGIVTLAKPFEYNKKMGSRANKIFKASANTARLLNERTDKLYLNLRVEL